MGNQNSLIFKIILILSLVLNISFGIYSISTMDCNSKKIRGDIAEKDKIANENQSQNPFTTISYNTKMDIFMAIPNDTNEIIFLGNSLTEHFPVTELMHDAHIRNRGISGEGIAQVINRLEEVTEGKPKKIFIEIGINDILNDQHADSIKKKYSQLISKIREQSQLTVIYLQSLLPTSFAVNGKTGAAMENIRLINAYLEQISDNKQVKYINLFDAFYDGKGLSPKYDSGDHLHLNGAGYLLWTDLIKAYVRE
ncbi:SGNH/GDSL hydrolase family protein [soil metagenome]